VAKIFVYELIDPRTDTVFYVGKGREGRGKLGVLPRCVDCQYDYHQSYMRSKSVS